MHHFRNRLEKFSWLYKTVVDGVLLFFSCSKNQFDYPQVRRASRYCEPRLHLARYIQAAVEEYLVFRS